jgi:GGDEF-like domain
VVIRLAGGSGGPAGGSGGPAGGSGGLPGGGSGDPGLRAQARVLEIAEAAASACRAQRMPALVGSLDDIRVGGLLALPPRADPDAVLASLAGALRQRLDPGDGMGAGSVVESVLDVQRSFLEAEQVAEVAARSRGGLSFYRLPDLRLRGLLHLLRDDPRVLAFAERELRPLHVALLALQAATGRAGGRPGDAATQAQPAGGRRQAYPRPDSKVRRVWAAMRRGGHQVLAGHSPASHSAAASMPL